MLASAKENKASLITNREALKVQPVALWAMECAFARLRRINMDFKSIYEQAVQAAQQAESDFIAKYGEPMYCGFAWVDVSGGRSPFVNWCRKNNVGRKGWDKGWTIWNPTGNFSQSMDLKEVGSRAFAEVLRDNGIEAYMGSRAD
jgi:hypothetical protein